MHPGRSQRRSPKASSARTPRSRKSSATPCTSIRPSPDPASSGRTKAVINSTASGLTGLVGNANDRGLYAGGP